MKVSTISKFSLVSISTLLMSHLAISPVLPKLYEYYHGMNPELGLASVESLATIPAMMITIFVLLSNLVMNKIGKKNTVLLGIGLIIIFGPLPAFITNFKGCSTNPVGEKSPTGFFTCKKEKSEL